jgi:hypothetical protein
MQFAQLKRREFVIFLGGLAVWPLAARAAARANAAHRRSGPQPDVSVREAPSRVVPPSQRANSVGDIFISMHLTAVEAG